VWPALAQSGPIARISNDQERDDQPAESAHSNPCL
jgi:hypothetical protein